MVTSLVLYGVIAFLVVPPRPEVDPAAWTSDPLVVGLHLAGLGVIAGSFIVPPALAKRGTAQPDVAQRQTWILRWALLESAGVFGLIAALLLRDARAFLLLGALSFVGLLLAFPRDEGNLEPTV
ncbi:MAG TPA: hypothetical protein VFV54_02140 [Thermoanaerobaculia bacterium]|nr:hypothetical protein [Thermoanaerobaculia bacterium]